jgi:bifunctional non-homologous end joining protein LigD
MKDSRKTVTQSETAAQPTSIKPMLATLIKQPFNDSNYIYEVKWDGYRIIAHKAGNSVKLQSRGGEDYSKKYPAVVKAVKEIEGDFIIDGEVVYINQEGKPDFDLLQKVNGQSAAPLIFYIFDLLWVNGENIMQRPLLERKEQLHDLIPENSIVKISDYFEDGLILYEHTKQLGIEGIVSKHKDSPYVEDQRGKNWYKIPHEQKDEYVIGGWIESEKRNTFRTLLFGEYNESGNLVWIGHAGGGYKDHEMPKILERLKSLETDKSPFVNEVDYSEGKPHWVKPELVANIKYSMFTKAGKIRKPAIFQGFREDKKAVDVIHQSAKEHLENIKSEPKTIVASTDSNWPETEKEIITTRGELTVDDYTVKVHNIEKEIWKGVTKSDLIAYYNSVADYILPHVKDRPLSLHIKHNGVNAPGLYIKDMEGRQPEFAEVYTTERRHKKAGKRNVIDYLVCNNRATLLYIINLRSIDLNPWTSTVHDPLHPSYIIIDLDPSDEDFDKVVETAKAAKDFFDEKKLKAFIKTSGKTGMHIYIPCTSFTFPQARKIAENICNQIHLLVPSITTREITVSDRGNKLYVDANQNDYADTVAAPYCARPFKKATISTPLEWKEVKDRLTPDEFNIKTIVQRIEKKGDLFAGVFEKTVGKKNSIQLKHFL